MMTCPAPHGLLIAVDPGLTTGIAVFARRHPIKPALLFARQIEIRRRPSDYLDALDDAQSYCDPERGPVQVVLESQYQGAGRSFPAIRSLIEIGGYIRYVSLARGCEVEEVMPATWQAVLRIRGCRLISAQLKALAQEVVTARYGHDIASIGEHACDAICIGMWWLETVAMDDKIGKGSGYEKGRRKGKDL